MRTKYIFLALASLLSVVLTGCSCDELTPQIDVQPEYEQKLQLNANSTHADSLIYQWYKDYNCAILYDFEEKDFRWLWASQTSHYYEKFDITNEEDSAALEKVLGYMESYFTSNYDSTFLAKNLPYKIFLTRELHKYSKDRSYENVLYNDQDAMFIGYMKSESGSFSSYNFNNNLGTVFAQIFFGNLSPQPTAFMNSAVTLKYNLLSWPIDETIYNEVNTLAYPDWLDKSVFADRCVHFAHAVGYVKGKNGTTIAPTQAQDYADMLGFITSNPGSYIRQHVSYYWRLAMRAGLLIEYFKEAKGEDLIAQQNEKYPDDKITLEDFSYEAK